MLTCESGCRNALANLDEVSVWITQVAADLTPVIDGRSQEVRTARFPQVVNTAGIGDANVKGAVGNLRLDRGSIVTCGLSSVGGPPTLAIIELLWNLRITGPARARRWLWDGKTFARLESAILRVCLNCSSYYSGASWPGCVLARTSYLRTCCCAINSPS